MVGGLVQNDVGAVLVLRKRNNQKRPSQIKSVGGKLLQRWHTGFHEPASVCPCLLHANATQAEATQQGDGLARQHTLSAYLAPRAYAAHLSRRAQPAHQATWLEAMHHNLRGMGDPSAGKV